jgi:hypothetical protein
MFKPKYVALLQYVKKAIVILKSSESLNLQMIFKSEKGFKKWRRI